jgi:hypothetical protein
MTNYDETPPNEGSVETIEKFADKFDTEEKVQAYVERVQALTKQFNEGAPIAEVRARDLKQLWQAKQRWYAGIPPEPNVAIGLGVWVAYGVEAAAGPPEEFYPISLRHELLSSLVERGVLNAYKHGDELDENVFEVAATMPCDKTDLAETMLPILLAKSPTEHVSKAKEEMHAGGYNPDESNVDSKFLDLLCKNC